MQTIVISEDKLLITFKDGSLSLQISSDELKEKLTPVDDSKNDSKKTKTTKK